MSVDPYMRRGWTTSSPTSRVRLNAPMDGGAIGEVVASASERFAPGDVVSHALGWREYAVVSERGAQKLDPSLAPLTAFLGVLGCGA